MEFLDFFRRRIAKPTPITEDESLSQDLSKATGFEQMTGTDFDFSGSGGNETPGSSGKPAKVPAADDSITTEVIRKDDLILNTYKVVSDAITGGMGSVWKVHHNSWNTDLAMKRPKPRFFAEGSKARKDNFIHECKAWIDLGLHPNIVSCYYVREIGGVPSIFSEWMDNGDAERHIKDGTLYAGTADAVQARLLDIAIQFARGLRYAHDHGLVHQDVKPANLLLSTDWEAKVSDFGIARARIALSENTGDPQSKNSPDTTLVSPTGGKTPAYCSPEQAAAQTLTHRTDIYSWAVSVMEMYLGAKPWTRPGASALTDAPALTGPLAGAACWQYFDMCTERPMPAALRELLAQCMLEDPEQRPEDFGVIEAALLDIYRETAGREYPRPAPKAASDTPDSLNNKALSFLDLGQADVSRECWKEALAKDPKHMVSLYNYALFQWRGAEIDDLQALHMLQLHEEEPDYARLAARLELERGNPEAAGELLEGNPEAAQPEPGRSSLEFVNEIADEERNAAQQLPALETQIQPLVNINFNENPFIEISPEGDRILCGEDGALLYSTRYKRPSWTDPQMGLHQGSSVFWGGPWYDATICSIKDYQMNFYGLSDDSFRGALNLEYMSGFPVATHYKKYSQLYAGMAVNDTYRMFLIDTENHNRKYLREKEIQSMPFDLSDRSIQVLFPQKGGFVFYYYERGEKPEITYFDGENWEAASRFSLSFPRGESALSADENGIWFNRGGFLALYDLNTGDLLKEIKEPIPNNSFNVCGDTLVTTVSTMLKEHYVKLLDPKSGRCLRSIPILGRCINGALTSGKTRIALIAYTAAYSGAEAALITMKKPSFAYSAKWELTRIHTASAQIRLEEQFVSILAKARQAMQAKKPEEALSLVKQAMGLSENLRSDPRARALLHEIKAQGTKVRLLSASLVQTLRANTDKLFFSEDAKLLYIAEKFSQRQKMDRMILDLDQGKLKIAKDLKDYYFPTETKRDSNEKIAKEALPRKPEDWRTEWDVSADGCCVAVVDCVIDMSWENHWTEATLRVGGGHSAIREETLPPYSSRQIFCDRLHFMKDGKTLLLLWQKTESTESRMQLTLTLWDASTLKQLKAIDVVVEPKTELSRRAFSPDKISMIVETFSVSPDERSVLLEIKASSENHNEYKYIMVDLATGETTAALPHPLMRLRHSWTGMTLYSNRLRFTGVGRQLAYIKDPSTVALTPLHEGEEEFEIQGDFNIPANVAVSPDGLFLAIAGGEEREEIYVYELNWELKY